MTPALIVQLALLLVGLAVILAGFVYGTRAGRMPYTDARVRQHYTAAVLFAAGAALMVASTVVGVLA